MPTLHELVMDGRRSTKLRVGSVDMACLNAGLVHTARLSSLQHNAAAALANCIAFDEVSCEAAVIANTLEDSMKLVRSKVNELPERQAATPTRAPG